MEHIKLLIFKQWRLTLFICLFSFLAATFEGMGVSFIFPIMEGMEISEKSKTPFPFNHITSLFTGYALDERLMIVAFLLIIVIALKSLFSYLEALTTARLQMVSFKHFSLLCYNQLMILGFVYLNRKKAGEMQVIFSKFNVEIGNLLTSIGRAVPQIFNFLIYSFMALLLSWQMTVVSIILIILSSIMLKFVVNRAEYLGKKLAVETAKLNAAIFELITAVKTIRVFNQETASTNFYSKEIDYNQAVNYRLVKINAIVQPFFELAGTISLSVILVVSTFFIVNSDSFGVAEMIVFIVIFRRISSSGLYLNKFRVSLISCMGQFNKIFDFLSPSADKGILHNGSREFKTLESHIEFKNVFFTYHSDEDYVLKNINLKVSKGQKIGIVGASGAGKSTITELLLRFYVPNSGQVLIDGIDISKWDIYSFRKKLGIVSQDIFLFNDSVIANISYGIIEASKEKIEEAAKKAFAHDFIKELPQGYDTNIGDRGVLLSGGEKQRIAIARAILLDPDILIFDEATSALDSESEKIVQEALNQISKGKTTISIAHRISTVADADKIFVFENGEISDEGTHNSLLSSSPTYKSIVQMQSLVNA